jgi:hypothetical protein
VIRHGNHPPGRCPRRLRQIDVKRELKTCYAPKNTGWELVDISELHFLAIDGHGDPNPSAAYRRAVEALYAVACTVKFTSKCDLGKDFVGGPRALRVDRRMHRHLAGGTDQADL